MDDKVKMTGTGRMGVAAIAATLFLCAPSALAQDEAIVSPVAPLVAESPTTEPEALWYDAFTLSMNNSSDSIFNEPATVDWQSENGRWGIMLGITDGSNESELEDPDLSASAFYNFGDRFRVGGQVRLTTPEDDLFRDQDSEERHPEVKFESALRF